MSDRVTPASDDPPHSYSTAYVARRLGVSLPTVQRWVDAGHLLAWKTPGGHRRVDARSADRMFEAQQRPSPAQPPSTPAAGSPEVVIVDDNPDDRDVLTAIVQTALPGALLRVFDNGIQALLAIGGRAPDILITDISMPYMDGLEMLRQLTALTDARPRLIVAASAHRDAQGAPTVALPAGVHFAPKPLDPQPLLALLRGAR